MKTLITIIFSLLSTLCFSQKTIDSNSLASGKNEFKLQAKKDTPNFTKAYNILTNEVRLNPKNAELRYFLGYTIDKMNASDGRRIVNLQKESTINASEQFEEVNKLEPIYKGEMYLLDPYSKITGIWGSLAEAYLNRKLIDSAKWAFQEGKKRGGFGEPVLEFNRQLLNSCDTNAILVTEGDNITIPIWYLQEIENYRSDVTAIDATLLNTIWYPKYLKSERGLKMSFSDAAIDTIEYLQWEPQDVDVVNPKDTTEKFSWELRPTYMDSYILKGNRMLLNIIQENFYSRPIYFCSSADSSISLNLSPYLVDKGLASRVTSAMFDYNEFQVSKNLYNYNIASINANDIKKSKETINVLNFFRWAFLNNIYNLVLKGNGKEADALIKLMNDRFSEEKLPFASAKMEKQFRDYLKAIKSYAH